MHGHSHTGNHQEHRHGVARDADRRYLAIALTLLLVFMGIEVIVGILASSLALISDAGHMLTDAASIALALFAIRMAMRPAQGHYTFGFKRVEILSAQINGITLLLLAAGFIFEAIRRLLVPPHVQGALVTIVAVAGIGLNLVAVWIMGKANRQSLNIEGSFQHILTDLYAFIATAVAGAIIWATGWNRLDAIAALTVAALMLKTGYALVRDSGRVFLEASPRRLDPMVVGEAICATTGVTGLSDLHIWEVTSGFPALAAHVFVRVEDDCHDKRRELEAMLHDRYDIRHTTLQMDHASDRGITASCRLDT
ncbi:MAG: cation diffusion facilitator family transporter [Rhodanobacteraceae bacterium]